ncbi:PAF family phospholipase A2 [Schizosaccharomyces japonicus yFS275]|uniref:Putative phospholipase n=1 Tax=Schizosaccharomyces japonicus (strain yFS275 / FY16936) TaxID=402676 RepID=B6K6H9_SCHJY|nr:PAF family phospholipase A2 [Schizosaccharomyces japonicus yFS275]EEB09133.1 PAF family phospholipase A2 [Schizosaccharomyces japonicus yFS275]
MKTTLPSYFGPLPVGSFVFELSVPSELRLKFDTIEPMETLKARIFYPIDPNQPHSTRDDEYWSCFREGMPAESKGIRRMAFHLCSLYFANTTLPIYDGQLCLPADNGKLPVVIFSHGLMGNRNIYSTLCGSLAAYGIVVVAMEHRDHSAIITTVRDPAVADEKPHVINYHDLGDLYSKKTEVKQQHRLLFRLREIQLAIRALRNINEKGAIWPGSPVEFSTSATHYEPVLLALRNRLQVGKGEIMLAGHSFGAATSVFISRYAEPSPIEGYPTKEDVKCLMLYDIWMLPVVQLNVSALEHKTIIIISHEFRNWTENFSALRDWTRIDTQQNEESGAMKQERLATIKVPHLSRLFIFHGTAHSSQSDVHLVSPTLLKRIFRVNVEADPNTAMDINVRASVQFLRENGVQNLHGKEEPKALVSGAVAGWEEIV